MVFVFLSCTCELLSNRSDNRSGFRRTTPEGVLNRLRDELPS